MKKSEYLKLNAKEAKFIWRGHKIIYAIGVKNEVIRCNINDHQSFSAEVLEDLADLEYDAERSKHYVVKVYWNKKVVATACTDQGFRFAGHMAVNMLRAAMTAKNSRRRWDAWEPEEEEAK